MHYLKIIFSALVACLVLSTAALSQSTGSKGVFTIHNNTKNNIVTGFYTNDGKGWSENWLSEQLKPKETADAKFSAQTGSCEQKLQIG